MTDQPFPDRVTQLRRRWEADRTSRLFLQLAEEYRQLGRLRESVDVLDAGLVEHPGYLSALVAKGRCHLDLDEPQAAREALERVVRQDATQAVASKLLVRAYIDLGELARARERLSLYALLHETDPDIAELRRRLEAPDLARPVVAVAVSSTHDQPGADPVGAQVATPARSDAMNEDIFDLRDLPRQPAPIAPNEDLFGLFQTPPPATPPASAPERLGDEIFGGLDGGESRRRWVEGLAEGGIFDLRVLELQPEPAPAPARIAQPTPAPIPAPKFDLPPFAAPAPAPTLGFEPPPVAEIAQSAEVVEFVEVVEITEVEVESEPEVELRAEVEETVDIEPERETVTLAELYLRQGHRDEALRILGQVLRREPENVAAHDLAARLRAGTAAAAPPAPEIPVPLSPLVAHAAPPVSKTKRKVQLLSAYLERLRRGSARGVS